jgi:Ni/Co efflux regulator RcnB
MHPNFRILPLAGAVLLAVMTAAQAETPLPDPIAPAVVGRPLDETWTPRPARQKPVARKPAPKAVTASSKGAVPQASSKAALPQATAKASAAPTAPTAVLGAPSLQQVARVVRDPLDPAGFLNRQDHALVRRFYEANPASVQETKWKIGERVPERAAITGVPREVRTALSPLPPGYQYVQLDGEVVLVAVQSRIVVDGVSRGAR